MHIGKELYEVLASPELAERSEVIRDTKVFGKNVLDNKARRDQRNEASQNNTPRSKTD